MPNLPYTIEHRPDGYWAVTPDGAWIGRLDGSAFESREECEEWMRGLAEHMEGK